MAKSAMVKGRFSARKKTEAVLRLLRGEDLDMLSRELGVEAHTLSERRDGFLAAGATVHADGYVMTLEYTGEVRAGELAPLVRIPVKTATYSSLQTATYSGGKAASDSGPNPPPSRTALMEGLWQN